MRKSPELYYSLLQFNESTKRWVIEFGDYDRSVVKAESDDYRDKGVKAKDLRIVVTTDEQSSILAAVAALNLGSEFEE